MSRLVKPAVFQRFQVEGVLSEWKRRNTFKSTAVDAARLFRSPKMTRGEGSVMVSLFIQSRRLPRASAHPHVRRSAHLRQPGPGTPFPGDVQ